MLQSKLSQHDTNSTCCKRKYAHYLALNVHISIHEYCTHGLSIFLKTHTEYTSPARACNWSTARVRDGPDTKQYNVPTHPFLTVKRLHKCWKNKTSGVCATKSEKRTSPDEDTQYPRLYTTERTPISPSIWHRHNWPTSWAQPYDDEPKHTLKQSSLIYRTNR